MQLATDFNEVEANEISLKMQIDWDRFLLSLQIIELSDDEEI